MFLVVVLIYFEGFGVGFRVGVYRYLTVGSLSGGGLI